jgi:hypothetical protein
MSALHARSAGFFAEPVDPAGKVDAGPLRLLLAELARRKAPAIVVFPKWRASSSTFQPGWIANRSLRREEDFEELAKGLTSEGGPIVRAKRKSKDLRAQATAAWNGRYSIELSSPQLFASGPALDPLVSTEEGVLVGKLRGDGPPVLVVSDPDLWSNEGLGKVDHAALLLDLVASLPDVRSVVFDETIHGYTEQGRLLAALLTFPVLPVTLQLLLAAALAVWVGAARFGSPRPPDDPRRAGRERFVETAARAMIGSSREAASLGRYWSQTLDAVADGLHLPPADPETRLRRLAALSSKRGVSEDPVTLDREVAEAAGKSFRSERWAALSLRIHEWRGEMLHAARRPS